MALNPRTRFPHGSDKSWVDVTFFGPERTVESVNEVSPSGFEPRDHIDVDTMELSKTMEWGSAAAALGWWR